MTPEQEQTMMELIESQHTLMLDIKALMGEQITIAREYKEIVGDPLKKGVFALKIIMHVTAWIAGVIMTMWGISELINTHVIFKGKP